MAEYFLSIIGDNDTNTCFPDTPTIWGNHIVILVIIAFGHIYPACEICSMEEYIMSKLDSNTNRHGIQ